MLPSVVCKLCLRDVWNGRIQIMILLQERCSGQTGRRCKLGSDSGVSGQPEVAVVIQSAAAPTPYVRP